MSDPTAIRLGDAEAKPEMEYLTCSLKLPRIIGPWQTLPGTPERHRAVRCANEEPHTCSFGYSPISTGRRNL